MPGGTSEGRVLKHPLQALLVAPDSQMRADILRGAKKITIREGARDYRDGQVMLCCHIEPWAVMAKITSVRHCALRDVTKKEYEDDGFETHEELLDGLKRFYPDLTLDSPVTVIRWGDIEGKLFRDYWTRDIPQVDG